MTVFEKTCEARLFKVRVHASCSASMRTEQCAFCKLTCLDKNGRQPGPTTGGIFSRMPCRWPTGDPRQGQCHLMARSPGSDCLTRHSGQLSRSARQVVHGGPVPSCRHSIVLLLFLPTMIPSHQTVFATNSYLSPSFLPNVVIGCSCQSALLRSARVDYYFDLPPLTGQVKE